MKMKLSFQVLLLVVMFALQKSQEADIEWITLPTENYFDWEIFKPKDESVENVTVPNITVYRQMEEREHDGVIVVCMFDQMFERAYSWQMQSFELSVESELNYTKEIEECTTSDRQICVFLVTVSPPASFTCEHEIHSNGEVKNLRSQTYMYYQSVLDHHEKGVSLFYICYSSFIAVSLVIMTVVVTLTTIRSKAKGLDSSASVVFQHTQTNPVNSFYTFVNTDSINPTTTVTDNDYMDA